MVLLTNRYLISKILSSERQHHVGGSSGTIKNQGEYQKNLKSEVEYLLQCFPRLSITCRSASWWQFDNIFIHFAAQCRSDKMLIYMDRRGCYGYRWWVTRCWELILFWAPHNEEILKIEEWERLCRRGEKGGRFVCTSAVWLLSVWSRSQWQQKINTWNPTYCIETTHESWWLNVPWFITQEDMWTIKLTGCPLQSALTGTTLHVIFASLGAASSIL